MRAASFARPGSASSAARVRSLFAFMNARKSGDCGVVSIHRYGSTIVVPKYVSVTGIILATGAGASAAEAVVAFATMASAAKPRTKRVMLRRP